MKVTLLLLSIFLISFSATAQKEVIVGQPADTTYLTLKGKDNTDAIQMDNDKLRIRHHYDFLVTDRDFLRILLDADNNQTNAIFSIYKDSTAGGNLIPPVRFSLDGYDSWINSGNFGIGDIAPLEKLSVNGAIKIGNNNFNSPGVIRFNNNAFEGYTNGAWRSLTQDADASPTNEIQQLILTGNSLKISNSNTIDLPFQEIRDADGDTYVTAENSPNEDKITVGLGSQSRLIIGKTTGSDRSYLAFPNNGNNILIGANSANIASTGINNIYIGGLSGTFNQDGSENIIIGRGSGLLNDQNNNVLIGNGVAANVNDKSVVIGNLAGNTSSQTSSVVIGYEAGKNAPTLECTYIGYSCGMANSGAWNTFIGARAGIDWESGSQNTLLGRNAGTGVTYGGSNTYIGDSAGSNNDNGSHNTFVGYGADALDEGTEWSLALGKGAQVTASFQAKIGAQYTTSIGGYEPWTNFSDGRYKSDIKSEVPGLIFINQLRPVTYHLEAIALDASLNLNNPRYAEERNAEALLNKEQIEYSGFIAQEVEAAAQSIGYDFSGVDKPKNENDFYGLRYAMFTVPLVKAVQELSAQNVSLSEEIETLKSENAALQNQLNSRLAALENQLNLLEQTSAAEKDGGTKTN